MPVLAAAAHPCAACPGHPGYDVLRGFKSAAPFGKSSCAANRCAAAATQAGASCIRDAGSPELSHSRIPDVACGHPLYAPLSTQPGETAKRTLLKIRPADWVMAATMDGCSSECAMLVEGSTSARAPDAGPICALPLPLPLPLPWLWLWLWLWLLLLLLLFQPVKRTEHRRPGGKKAAHVSERSELWAAPTWPRSAGDRLAQPAGSRPGVLSSWLLLLCTSKEEVTRQSRVAAGETALTFAPERSHAKLDRPPR